MTLSRREFLMLSTIALTNPGGCSVFVQRVVIPALTEVAVADLYAWAKTTFTQVFAAGETLASLPAEVVGFEGVVAQEILDRFKGIDAGNPFCTPIIAVRHGTHRFLQLAEAGSAWSLVTGGPGGDQVFTIHNNWLTWLLGKDDCNLRFNGNTAFGPCGKDGCEAFGSRQRFLDVNGEEVALEILDEKRSGQALLFHRASGHAKSWHGCSIQTPGDPDQCVL